ncbi:MAG: DUF3047 domain-containing protein [Nitrospirae bacterium]|nr:MAG: DUF3047 domain-containing protein [Nitrospirota bacterium]
MGEPAMPLTTTILIVLPFFILDGDLALGQGASVAVQVLEDFSKAELDGFPVGWQASRNESVTRKAYVVTRDGEQSLLRTKGVDAQMRIFKRVAWNPKEYPIVTWRWRLANIAFGGKSSVPPEKQIIAAVFISLDTDLLVIPVSTKYVWYEHGSVGAVKEGGLFGAAEVVVRSGPQPIGQWVEERVNAYADFLKIHNHEPAPMAWGISFVTGPGVELDFGRIAIAKQ